MSGHLKIKQTAQQGDTAGDGPLPAQGNSKGRKCKVSPTAKVKTPPTRLGGGVFNGGRGKD
jgi:hypothetical protein